MCLKTCLLSPDIGIHILKLHCNSKIPKYSYGVYLPMEEMCMVCVELLVLKVGYMLIKEVMTQFYVDDQGP